MHHDLSVLFLASVCAVLGPGFGAAPSSPPTSPPPAVAAPSVPDGSHDFDFEFGTWKAKLSRRLRPLTGSTAWVEYEGTNVVTKIWGGRANFAELDVSGTEGRVQGLSLRLYDPKTHQWYIRWSNAADGAMGPPMIGGFRDGRGEFYNQEELNGRPIFVRFIFSGITGNSFQIEQAFSADGGATWETNWISRFTR